MNIKFLLHSVKIYYTLRYTWPRACHALTRTTPLTSNNAIVSPATLTTSETEHLLLAMRTIACTLHAAAFANLLPRKWGGVFGQEFIAACPSLTPSSSTQSGFLPPLAQTRALLPPAGFESFASSAATASSSATTVSAGNLMNSFSDGNPLLPVTLVSGLLGASKTSFIEKLLLQSPIHQRATRVAVIDNSAALDNTDVTRLQTSYRKIEDEGEGRWRGLDQEIVTYNTLIDLPTSNSFLCF